MIVLKDVPILIIHVYFNFQYLQYREYDCWKYIM